MKLYGVIAALPVLTMIVVAGAALVFSGVPGKAVDLAFGAAFDPNALMPEKVLDLAFGAAFDPNGLIPEKAVDLAFGAAVDPNALMQGPDKALIV